MIKGLLKQSKGYWICVSIVAVLCYGFMLTNYSIGIDDERFTLSFFGNHLLKRGLWGYLPLREVFNTYSFLPFWRDFISLLLFVFSLTLFSGLLRKYSDGKYNDKAAAIFTSIVISFPYFADLFVFMMTTVELGIHLTCTVFSLLLATNWLIEKKSILYGVPSALLLGYAVAFNQVAIIFFLVMLFTLLLFYALFSSEGKTLRFSQLLWIVVKTIGLAVAGLIVWWLGGLAFQKLLNVVPDSYISNKIIYDRSSVSAFIKSVLQYIPTFIKTTLLSPTTAVDKIIVGAAAALVAISAFFSIRRKKISIFIIGLALVFSAFAMYFVMGKRPEIRTSIPFSIMIAACIVLLYVLLQNVAIKKFKAKYVVVFIAVWLVFFQSRELNTAFFTDHQRYQRDVSVMEMIVDDFDGLDREKPILFVGILPDPLPHRHEVIGHTLYNWDRSSSASAELDCIRIHDFFKMHGFPFTRARNVDTSEVQAQIAEMENWPADGYVKEFESYVIVKLGASKLDTPTE